MTERERYPEPGDPTTPIRRDVYYERSTEQLSDFPDDAHREVSREQHAGPYGNYEPRREHVVLPNEIERRAAIARRIQQVIGFVIGTIVVLLVIRFVLLLLGANEASSFVQLIYGLTLPLVAPFQGIFGEPVVGASVLEWASVVAMICYSLIGYGLSKLVDVIYKPNRVGAVYDE